MRETENGKENWAAAIDRAKQHFNEGWRDLGKAAELAKENGETSWKEAQAKGRETWVNAKANGMEIWEDAKETGAEVLDEARARGEEALKDAERLVRKYPVKAIGLSVLVGVFLGAFLGRGRD